MKFTRAKIYGFGKWIDKEITFNHKQLNVIYGEKVSGKTILQQLIMYIVYDVTLQEQTYFQPVDISKVGGILTFLDENNEEITIERTVDSLIIYSKDEPSHKEEVLEHYLKG